MLACAIALGLFALGALATGQSVHAQEGTIYVVQPGDTLGAISDRFDVPIEQLAAANGLANADVIWVGQELIIPGTTTQLPQVMARPGDTLSGLAQRYGLTAEQLSAINGMETNQRLFPGQPVRLPAHTQPPAPPGFGAIQSIVLPGYIVQGETGELEVVTRKPVSLTAIWNDLPLAIKPLDDPLHQFAHLPVPALLGPGKFDLEIGYTAANGRQLTRTLTIDVVEGDYISQEINLPQDKGGLLDAQLIQAELEKLRTIWLQTDTPIQWRQPLLRPIAPEYPTTSPYGTRRSYNGGPYSSYHSGQDFGAPEGVTVTAPADGIVALAETLNVRGNAVVLDHGRGVYTGYWHLSQLMVQPGQTVAAGDPIGLVGTTGLSTGAHLHWEMRIYGISVSPMQFLNFPLFPSEASFVQDTEPSP
jgi:murein DD-endopeptidase MepM/ murein hydrolase activator NlpD